MRLETVDRQELIRRVLIDFDWDDFGLDDVGLAEKDWAEKDWADALAKKIDEALTPNP